MPRIDYIPQDKEVYVQCRTCKKIYTFPCSAKQWKMLNGGYVIQQVFPRMSADDRELFVSGMCGACFDAMFEDMEDGPAPAPKSKPKKSVSPMAEVDRAFAESKKQIRL